MTMRVQFKKVQIETEEVEVTLPLYRCHDVSSDSGGSSEIYTMIARADDGEVWEYTIHVSSYFTLRRYDLHIEPFRSNVHDDADFVLGRNRFALTEERWNEVLLEFEEWATKLGFIKRM